MTPDNFQQAWQAHSSQTRVTIDADLLRKEVESSHRAFQTLIFWRDAREVGVSLLLIPVWLGIGLVLPLPWTWYLTVPALVWVAGFLLVDRRRHPPHPGEPGEPLVHYVNEAVKQVEHQIWLLRNVFWWYLLPFSTAIMAFFGQVAWNSSSTWGEFLTVMGGLSFFLFLVYGWIYRVNQQAVRTQLDPRRVQLLKLVEGLEAEPPLAGETSQDLFDLIAGPDPPVSEGS